jgi:membrane associated rhomboid family serine protease
VSNEEDQGPVCVRHADRHTYLSCQRCGRPACTQCLVPASVGFHCVDCVRENSGATPQIRRARRATKPVVTISIIALTFLVYVIQQSDSTIFFRFSLIGLAQYPNGTWLGVANYEWYRLLTVGLLHASWWHIGFNMYALWVLGPSIEAAFGRSRYLTIYVASLLGGSTASLLFNSPRIGAIGASGAIFGLFGATIIANKRLGRPVNSVYAIIAINLAFGFMVPNVDWHAHLGGLLLGSATSAIMVYGVRRPALIGLAMLGETGILAVLIVMRVAALRAAVGL